MMIILTCITLTSLTVSAISINILHELYSDNKDIN